MESLALGQLATRFYPIWHAHWKTAVLLIWPTLLHVLHSLLGRHNYMLILTLEKDIAFNPEDYLSDDKGNISADHADCTSSSQTVFPGVSF